MNIISKDELPRCFIRQDRAHTLHSVVKWDSFKKYPLCLDFYTRCVGYCIEEENLEEIRQVAIAMIIMSQSPTMNPNSICEQKKDMMIQKFKTFQRQHNRDPLNSSTKNASNIMNLCMGAEDDIIDMDDIVSDDCNLGSFIEDICKEAESLLHPNGRNKDNVKNVSITDTDNTFKCPGILKNIKYLFSQVFVWSNLMVSAFDSPHKVASSALIEEYFKDIKKKGYLLKLNKFVLWHTKEIKARCISAKAALDYEIKSTDALSSGIFILTRYKLYIFALLKSFIWIRWIQIGTCIMYI